MAGEYTLDVLVNPIENPAAARAMGSRMGDSFSDGFNKAAKQPLGRITSDVSQFQRSIEASNARVIAFGASAGSIYLVQAAFRKLLSDAVIVQKSLTDINVILGLGSTAMKSFSNEMFKAASQTGQTFETAGKVALEFARHGVSASETAKRMTSAMQLMRISGLGATDAVNSITAAINAFSKEGITSADIVNRLTAVDTKFAVSAQDLAKAVQRVGATAEDAGVRFNQLLGFVAAAQTVTARGGAVIGNAFKSIFTRLARPQVLDDLESIGVTTKTAAGQILPMVTILKNLASQYDHLSYSQKSFVSEAVGGVYQVNILKASLADLGNGLSIFDKATMAAEQSTGLIDKRMSMLNETISSKLNTSVLEITKLFANFSTISFGSSSKSGLDGMNQEIASISKLFEDIVPDDSVGTKIGKTLAVGIVKGLGDIVSGPGIQLAMALLVKSFGTLGTFAIQAGREFLGANSQAERMAAIQKSISSFILSNAEAQTVFNNQLLTGIQRTEKIVQMWMQANVASATFHAQVKGIAEKGAVLASPNIGGYQSKASGYVPDFASEESEARSLGALNPKAEWGKGTIGGKKFIKNDQEIEIPGFGRNGDSAVIPMYADGFYPVHPKEPYSVYDTQNRTIVRKGFYENIRGLRRTSENKNQEYGAYRYTVLPHSELERRSFEGMANNPNASMSVGSKTISGNDILEYFNQKENTRKANLWGGQYADGYVPPLMGLHVKPSGNPYRDKNARRFNGLLGELGTGIASPDDSIRGPTSKIFEKLSSEFLRNTLSQQGAGAIESRILGKPISPQQFKQFEKLYTGLIKEPYNADEFHNYKKPLYGDSFPGYDSIHTFSTHNEELAKKLGVNVGDLVTLALQSKGGKNLRIADFATMDDGDSVLQKEGYDKPSVRALAFRDATTLPGNVLYDEMNRKAAGFLPLTFKKTFNRTFGTHRLFGMNGSDPVGDIEYSGSKMKEIEGFDIYDKYRGKGLAKQFYQALGKGSIKGTILPNTDSEGNTFFPQLSRASVAKDSYVLHYGYMDKNQKISVADFKKLISAHKGDSQFWEDNSFDLHTQHAAGFIPNFASQNIMDSVFVAASKMPNSANIIEKLKEGSGLSDESFLKAAKILGVNMGGGSPVNPNSMWDNINQAFNSKKHDDWWKNVDVKLKARDAKFGYPITDNEQTNINFVQGLFKRKFSSFSNVKDMMDHREYSGEQNNETGAFGTGLDFNSDHDTLLNKFKEKYFRTVVSRTKPQNTNLHFSMFGAEFGLDDDFKDSDMSYGRQSSLEKFFAKRMNKYSSRGRFSSGFVPNFSPLSDAVKREMSAGYSSSQIRIDKSPSLISSSNPSGLGVYNSTEGSLSNGITLAQSAGINPKTKGMAAGFVPNFDMGNIGMSMMLGIFQGSVTDVSKKLNFLSYGYDKQIEHLRKINEEYTAIENDIKVKGSATYNGQTYTTGGRGSKFREDFKAANAGSGLTFYPDAVKKQEQDYGQYIDKKSATQQKIKGFAFQSMFGAPIAAETLSSSASSLGFANVAKGLETFSGGLTLASQMLSLLPNKLGSALAAGELITSLGSSISVAVAKVGTYEKALDVQSTALERMSSASNTVLDSYNKLNQLYNSSTSTFQDFITQQKRLSEALQDLGASLPNGKGADLVRQITSAGSDEDRRTAVAQAQDAQQQERNVNATKLALAQAKVKSSFFGIGVGNSFTANNKDDIIGKRQLLEDSAKTMGEVAESSMSRSIMSRLTSGTLTDRDISAITNRAEQGPDNKGNVLGLQGDSLKTALAQLKYNLEQFKLPSGISPDVWAKRNEDFASASQAEIALRNRYNQELQNALAKGAIVSDYLYKSATAGEEIRSGKASYETQKSGFNVRLAGLTTNEAGMIGLNAQQKSREANDEITKKRNLNFIKGNSDINGFISKTIAETFAGKLKSVQDSTAGISPQKQAEAAYLAKQQIAFAKDPKGLIDIANNPEAFAQKFLGGTAKDVIGNPNSGITNEKEYDVLSNSLSSLAKTPEFYAKLQDILTNTQAIEKEGFLRQAGISDEQLEQWKEVNFKDLAKSLSGLSLLDKGGARTKAREIKQAEWLEQNAKDPITRGRGARTLLENMTSAERDYSNPWVKKLASEVYAGEVTGDKLAKGNGAFANYTNAADQNDPNKADATAAGFDNSRAFAQTFSMGFRNGPKISLGDTNPAGAPPSIDITDLQANIKVADTNLDTFGKNVGLVGSQLATLLQQLKTLESTPRPKPPTGNPNTTPPPISTDGSIHSFLARHGEGIAGTIGTGLAYGFGSAVFNRGGTLLKGPMSKVGQWGKNAYKEFREGKVAVPEVKIPTSAGIPSGSSTIVTPMTEAEQQARELKLRKIETFASRTSKSNDPSMAAQHEVAKDLHAEQTAKYEKQLEDEAKYSKDFSKNDYSHILNAPKKPMFSNAPFAQFKGDEATKIFNKIPQSRLLPTVTKATSAMGKYAAPLLRTLNPLMKYGGKALGVAGTLASGYDAIQDFRHGDYWGAAGNAATTAAGFTGVGRAFNAGYYGGQAVGDAATWLGGHKNNALAAQYGQNAQNTFDNTNASTGDKATSLAYFNARIKSYQNSLNSYGNPFRGGGNSFNPDIVEKLKQQISNLENQKNSLYNSPNKPKTESASPAEGPAPADDDTQSQDNLTTSMNTLGDKITALTNAKSQVGVDINVNSAFLTATINSAVGNAFARLSGKPNPVQVTQPA